MTTDSSAAKATEAPAPTKLEPGRKLRKRRNPWPVRAVVILLIAGGGFAVVRNSKPKPIAIEAVTVTRGNVLDEISSASAGEVMAEQKAIVRAELSGRAVAVKQRRGDRVKKGDVIVLLDAGDLDARMRQADATLAATRAQALQADARAEAAHRTADRMKNLLERGAETKQGSDDAATNAREAAAAAQAAHAQLEQAEASIQVAKVAKGKTALTAPFDGLLADVAVDQGTAVQMGALLFELIDDSRLHVEATIDEADIGRVKVGQPATLRLDALPGKSVPGAVSKMDPTVRKDERGARTLRIEVEVTDLKSAVALGVRPGMSANVDVRVAEKNAVLSVPTSVIIGRGSKRSVYVVESGVAKERKVEVGMANWERTEITTGLQEKEQVVSTLNVKGLADGAHVQIGAGEHGS